ncbi:hypothetical protein WJX73_003255 [Symbiochloris irregularis]|uniref:F-box domain-containing protein n=1 Tax=Symbiochloris irregularis TaxID=706552 RepID=A0AAW1PFH3_9CHLO
MGELLRSFSFVQVFSTQICSSLQLTDLNALSQTCKSLRQLIFEADSSCQDNPARANLHRALAGDTTCRPPEPCSSESSGNTGHHPPRQLHLHLCAES